MSKDEFIDFVYMMHLQNTNGRESTNEMFRLGIEAAYDEMMILFHSKEELTKHIQNNMPIAIRPTKKSKTMYIDPFTSNNARKICIDAIVKSLERYL